MSLLIDHNLLHNVNNIITLNQWQQIKDAVEASRVSYNEPPNALYKTSSSKNNKTRHSIYDNYDRFFMPGFDLHIEDNADTGTLTVYNSSEQARAPITFEQGMQIAKNFFNEYGCQMAEEIVCEWVMDGNPSIF